MLLSIDSYGISMTRRSNNPSLDVSFLGWCWPEESVNQEQHQPSCLGKPAAPIQNGSASASINSVEQSAPAAKPYIADVILKFSLLKRIIKSLWNKRTELIFGSKFYFRRSWYVCLVFAISGALDVPLRWSLTRWKAYEILYISSVGFKSKFGRFNGVEWDVSWRRG